MEEETQETVTDELTPKQELFCRNFVLNDEFYGNRTLSYANAYGFDLDNQSKDDAVYDWIYEKGVKKKGDLIEPSSYQKMYDLCSSYGSRLTRNDKIQRKCREFLNEMANEDVIDARLRQIILRGRDQDSVNAIKEFNKLKQRIVEKTDITSKGEKILVMPVELMNKNNEEGSN